MVKFKIVLGTMTDPADKNLNAWLTQNPNVEILSFKYEQARYGDHSICIMYEEREN